VGQELGVAQVTNLVLCALEGHDLDGITFSGGEPMQQAYQLLRLVELIQRQLPALSFGMYSGYSERELTSGHYWCRGELITAHRQELWQRIRRHLDFAVLGRYVPEQPSALPLQTSANQRLKLFSDRYREQNFGPQEIEVHIGESGLVQVTGFPVAGAPV
jgi:anaerobic ribonucleoside-triphosphate reductase activating protein